VKLHRLFAAQQEGHDLTSLELEAFDTAEASHSRPLCSSIRAGNTVYVSGCLGRPDGEQRVVEGGVAAEARQALHHMRASLEVAGSSVGQVAKCLVFLTDMADFDAMNEVYGEVFGTHRPARTVVAVAELAFSAKFEIECVALTD
jgi:2-iminobutanoate/2-iminopropanoate deaminase